MDNLTDLGFVKYSDGFSVDKLADQKATNHGKQPIMEITEVTSAGDFRVSWPAKEAELVALKDLCNDLF